MTDFTEDGILKLNEGEKLKAKRGSTDAEEAEDSGTEADEETTEEAAAEEIKTQVEKEEYEVTDDLARMYLHEIGKVPLLTAAEERNLSRKIERASYLQKIQIAHFKKYKEIPSSADIAIDLMSRFSKARFIVEVVREYLGIDHSCSPAEIITDPKFHDAIDNEINLELISAVAQRTAKGVEVAVKDIVDLSLSSNLLPVQLLALAGVELSWQEIKTFSASDESLSQLRSYNSQCELPRNISDMACLSLTLYKREISALCGL